MTQATNAFFQRSEKYRHLAEALRTSSCPDQGWSIVVLFYSALHLIEAYLSTKAGWKAAASHAERREAEKGYPELRRYGDSYRKLREASEFVRYDPAYSFEPAHYLVALQQHNRISSVLKPLLKRLKAIG